MKTATTIFCTIAAVLFPGACPNCTLDPGGSDVIIGVPTDTGFSFSGPFDLTATVDPQDGGGWTLEGSFTFPTSGYVVVGPQVTVLESFPEQVIIGFTIVPPGPNTVVLQVLTEEPFSADISVSAGASFTMDIRTVNPLGL